MGLICALEMRILNPQQGAQSLFMKEWRRLRIQIERFSSSGRLKGGIQNFARFPQYNIFEMLLRKYTAIQEQVGPKDKWKKKKINRSVKQENFNKKDFPRRMTDSVWKREQYIMSLSKCLLILFNSDRELFHRVHVENTLSIIIHTE